MIWFGVATIHNPSPEPFAVIRVDTDERRENGCEGVVMSLHMTHGAAAEEASRHNRDEADLTGKGE